MRPHDRRKAGAAGSAAALGLLLVVVSCGGAGPAAPTPPAPGGGTVPGPALAGFQLEGDAATTAGATWTYRATVGGVAYDLRGILRKPAGNGPFAAVIVSHGSGENVAGYPRSVAAIMVDWGLVVVAANYTHAGGVPVGAPGGIDEPGSSDANVARGRRLLEVLRSLGYVDMTRVAAHGHSAGAFVTTALAGAEPQAFRAVSHSAGGVVPDALMLPASVPRESVTGTIRAPYQIHHGGADAVVPLQADQLLASSLTGRGVANELFVYNGAAHNDVAVAPEVFSRIRAWYIRHGLM